ncbi:transposase mutator type [Sulfolobus islandicus Y.G.57.14]|uniref:Transposase mutator type n=1 Tax=Saccharolobus islandicus (strain Y.G.57.14 / Yellowstone \|nr:IS256-like element ISC1332 family transposase [Sulfolobus islandicus]ACP44917.1 transposase mutator type [Sulfolobus islandicus Y.G.57.14]
MTKSKNNPGRGNTIRESNTMKVMEEIREKIRKAIKEGVSLREIEEIILQEAMMEEREAYLQVEDDHKNGTYFRYLGTGDGVLRLRVPRTRKGGFRPKILPEKYERTSPDYEDFLQQLVLSGMTPSQVKAVLAAKGIPYSEIVMNRVAERISNKLKEYKSRELPHDLLALYIDVKIVKVRISESIMERAIYIAIGVDLEGNKFVLDYEVRDREDLDGWKSFLSGLVSRGVSRVDVIVSDDFSGLDRVVSTLFPSSQHQLCITHMVRNLMRVLPDKEELMIRVRDLKFSRNVEEGRKAILSLSQLVQPFSPARAKRLLDAADKYCSFLNFPREIRHYLYTNNTSESFNSTLARFEEELGGYFPSLRSLEVYLYVSIHESNSRWKFRPMSVIRHYSYHLKQLHASRFQVSLDEDF